MIGPITFTYVCSYVSVCQKYQRRCQRRYEEYKKKDPIRPTTPLAGGLFHTSPNHYIQEVQERFDRGHHFPASVPVRRRRKRWETGLGVGGGWRRGSLGRSSDAYSAGKRGKVRTTTNMVSSSLRGGGPQDKTEIFAFKSCPSFHCLLLKGNIVEEIPSIFRLFF